MSFFCRARQLSRTDVVEVQMPTARNELSWPPNSDMPCPAMRPTLAGTNNRAYSTWFKGESRLPDFYSQQTANSLIGKCRYSCGFSTAVHFGGKSHKQTSDIVGPHDFKFERLFGSKIDTTPSSLLESDISQPTPQDLTAAEKTAFKFNTILSNGTYSYFCRFLSVLPGTRWPRSEHCIFINASQVQNFSATISKYYSLPDRLLYPVFIPSF